LVGIRSIYQILADFFFDISIRSGCTPVSRLCLRMSRPLPCARRVCRPIAIAVSSAYWPSCMVLPFGPVHELGATPGVESL
jgi:hypothetical protein